MTHTSPLFLNSSPGLRAVGARTGKPVPFKARRQWGSLGSAAVFDRTVALPLPNTRSPRLRLSASPGCLSWCFAPQKYATCSPISFAVRYPFPPSASRRVDGGQACCTERGSVTAEFALAIPAVALVLVCCLSGVQLAGLQVRLQDAAAASARNLARDESPASVAATASDLVSSARLATHRRDDLVCATVSAPARNALLGLLPITLSASSCALAGGK